MRPGERKRCEACGREMIGAVHPRTRNVAPILLAPDPEGRPGEEGKGNVLLFQRDGEVRYAIIANAAMRITLREAGVPLRLNHFADCPAAAQFHRT